MVRRQCGETGKPSLPVSGGSGHGCVCFNGFYRAVGRTADQLFRVMNGYASVCVSLPAKTERRSGFIFFQG